MSINNVGNNQSVNKVYDLLQQKAHKTNKQVAAAKSPWQEDVVELSKEKPDVSSVNGMKADLQKNTDALKKMVLKLLEKQGGYTNKANGQMVEIDAATRAQAQEMISEDGYWGVNKTAERILNFAKAISGGDASKIEELKNAVMKGFDEAEKAWGGKLPDISQKTLDKVMEGFKQWEDENK